jgi:hypothetical protein
MKDLFILGMAVPGEALETMVELHLWPSIVLLRKLAIYCDWVTAKIGLNGLDPDLDQNKHRINLE